MENLSDLDDCINTLEKLQLTLDFETSTVKRNPKSFSPTEFTDYNNSNSTNNRVDLVLSNQHRSDQDCYDIHLPDITKSSITYKTENHHSASKDIPNTVQLCLDNTDFKSLLVRRPKLTSNMSVDSDLFAVPECEATDFPPPPPPINIDNDSHHRTYIVQPLTKPESPVNSSPSATGNIPLKKSDRNYSTNSLKFYPKPLMESFPISTKMSSAGSSQSNLSSPLDKESKEAKTFPSVETMSETTDRSNQTVVRFFSSDKTTKALFIGEKMTVEAVIKILMEKNFWIPSLKSAIVEKVPSLKMERFFEEHEYLLDCVNNWPATCSNMIFFEQREDIYGLFENAKINLGDNYPPGAMNVDAIKNLFLNITTGQHDYQDYIYIKKPQENSWKRKFCLLNDSGIMTMHKKKSKPSKSRSNVMSFNERYFLYTTTGGWTKEWDAPTPFGFAFKPYSVVDPKSEQLIMFCASDEVSMKRWCSNLRLCKYKNQILNNYQQMQSRSIYCSNLFMSDHQVHQVNRTHSLSPNVYGTYSSNYNSRSSLPTAGFGGQLRNSNKFKF